MQQFLKSKNHPGITLVEILLVVGLVTIVAASTTPFLARMVIQTHHESANDFVYSSITKAQSYAMDQKQNETWGVCLSGGDTITFFSGSCASPTYQEDFSIPNSISITGLSETTFNLRGEPSAAATITISSSHGDSSYVLNQAGGISP